VEMHGMISARHAGRMICSECMNDFSTTSCSKTKTCDYFQKYLACRLHSSVQKWPILQFLISTAVILQ